MYLWSFNNKLMRFLSLSVATKAPARVVIAMKETNMRAKIKKYVINKTNNEFH